MNNDDFHGFCANGTTDVAKTGGCDKGTVDAIIAGVVKI